MWNTSENGGNNILCGWKGNRATKSVDPVDKGIEWEVVTSFLITHDTLLPNRGGGAGEHLK